MPSLKLTVASLLGTLAYLALAVLGWGGIAPFLAHPARIVLTVVTFALTIASLFSRGNLSPGEREDRGNRWVIAAFGAIGLLQAYLPAYTDRTGLGTIDGDTAHWVGVAPYVAGGVLRLWPVFVLGRRFSGLVAIQPGHTLVTTGIYRTIHNPSNLGLVIATLGWSLAFRSWVGVLLTALTVPPLVARMNAEEALLASEFGAEYEAYRGRTWRLVPHVH